MSPTEERRERLILVAVPALILALGCGARLMPPAAVADILFFLSAWSLLSIPLAVLIGHCALGED